MVIFAVIIFSVAILCVVLGLYICKGRTSLIHSYHQMKVHDKVTYGKAFGSAMIQIGVGMALSGLVSLIDSTCYAAMTILLFDLVIGFSRMFAIQKKYNGGVF